MKRSSKYSKGQIKICKVRGLDVSYTVEHRRVKYPRLEFKSPNKLLVVLPYGLKDETELLAKKESWIWKKMKTIDRSLDIIKQYEGKNRRDKIIFGTYYEIRPRVGKYGIKISEGHIEVSAPTGTDHLVYLRTWLREELRRKTIHYLDRFSEELGQHYRKVYIRSQKTKWATCSSKGNIGFNIRMSALPEELVEYIVAHETVHLIEHNHNRKFWKLMESIFPDYKEKEALLTGFWFLIDKDQLWNNISEAGLGLTVKR
jgi:predicted metal-dependent hydrolase